MDVCIKPTARFTAEILGMSLDWIVIPDGRKLTSAADLLTRLNKDRADTHRMVTLHVERDWWELVSVTTRPSYHVTKEGCFQLIMKLSTDAAKLLQMQMAVKLAQVADIKIAEESRPRAPYAEFVMYRDGGGRLTYTAWGDEVWWPEEQERLIATTPGRRSESWEKFQVYQQTGGKLAFFEWRERIWNSGSSGLGA